MLSHQIQVKVQVQADASASLPADSLPAKCSTLLTIASAASLPPGPPSSSTGQSVGPGGSSTNGADLVQNMETCSSLPSLPISATSGTAGGSSTAPPLTWAEADRQWLVSQSATHVEGLVLAGSSQNSTGFEGVYRVGSKFGAELQKGGNRLRQDGFRSPVEAALERARWTKSLEEGKGHAPSATAEASSGEQELLAAEALADLATAEGATVAQPFVSAKKGAAPTKHKDRRRLAPLRNLAGFLEGVCTSKGGSDAELQKGAKHPWQTGASSPPQAPLERADHTEEDRETTVTTSPSSVASEVTVPHQHAAASECSSACSTVEEKFAMHVICNYTPRAPGELPMKRWVSCAQMLRQLQPHAPAEDYIKQLITDHFKDHPAFAGHPFHAWGKKLKDYNAPDGGGRTTVMKFSLEYTPTGA
eukprot:scaffold1967_cov60-Phaeocystis_antarctica.AAC.1